MQKILLTIDVEDWFQVENLRPWNPPSTWHERELRVERSTHRILDLLDSMPLSFSSPAIDNPQPATLQASQPPSLPASQPALKATFFVLGWIARRCPGLVREIRERGHEVASHGDGHLLCSDMSCSDLDRDLQKSKALLEDLCGREVAGYRAPSFSVSEKVLDRIRQAGYRYDSSYNSFALHERYGKVDFRNATLGSGVALKVKDGFFELPLSNLSLQRRTIPWGGGGYFRLLPSGLFTWGVRRILQAKGAYVFYMHPWEFDPGQPRVREVSWQLGFRHYVNLDKTEAKLKRLVKSFSHCRFVSCSEYLHLADSLTD
ncbi:MAG: DUF3473 domain-containing protein [Desulfohalobiaceae bacterium]|nr:DUF3473 domain-containing protein [Desulfohalobiaceae bacterium]